jgi:DNA-binding helix-hairpin-helix protein with protein kinase domain
MCAQQYYDHVNRPVSAGPLLGRGGEGNVYDVMGDPTHVAKIYLKPASAQQAEKLRHMVSLARADLLRVAAWPTATLHDGPGGPVVGLLMPKVVRHKELHTLYSPAHRRSVFPQASWPFLIHAGMNCAIAFHHVHATGAVVGDVNQSNVLVSEQATVTLIDCDSFQIRAVGRIYPCEVGVPLFTPPELQGKGFRGVERTTNHDLFGLAALIFHLLFMGRHPYSGRFLGASEMPIERAIAEYRFAYSRGGQANQMARPPHSLTLDAIPADLSALFERAFGRASAQMNARPTAQEWVATLNAFSKQLTRCAADPGHLYWRSLPHCPWCELMRQGAPNFFITVVYARPRVAGPAFVLGTVWSEIESIPRPTTAYQRPAPQRVVTPSPPPPGFPVSIPPFFPIPWTFLQKVTGATAASAGAFMLLSVFVLWLVAFFLITFMVFGVWWLILEAQRQEEQRQANAVREERLSAMRKEVRKREASRTSAWTRLQVAERNRNAAAQYYERVFAEKYRELQSLKERSSSLDQEYAVQRQQLRQRLQSEAQRIQLEQYLDQKFISDHNIPGIGPARTAELASNGIETALDVSWDRVQQIKGFGPKLTQALMAWRQQYEQSFVFNPSAVVYSTEERTLEVSYLQSRQQVEIRLRKGPEELKAIATKAMSDLYQHLQYIRSLVEMVTQAEADVNALPRIA